MDDPSSLVGASKTPSTATAVSQGSQLGSTRTEQLNEPVHASQPVDSVAGAADGGGQGGGQSANGTANPSYLTMLPVNCIMNVVRPEVNTVVQSSMQSNGKDKRKSSGESGGAAKIKISNEARQCFVDSATEFVMFITQEASDRCVSENRRTLTGSDVVAAIENLGFGSQYAMIARMALSRLSSGSQPPQSTDAVPLTDIGQQQQQQQQQQQLQLQPNQQQEPFNMIG